MGQKSTDSAKAGSTGFGSGSSAKRRAKEDEAERDKGAIASNFEKRMSEQHEILEGKKTSLEATKKSCEKASRALWEHSDTLEAQSILARQFISDTDDAYAQVTASEATICAHVENLRRTTNKVERCLEERPHLLGTKKKILDTKRQLSKKKLVEIEDQYQKSDG